ncbi:hypothetical protein OPQ81_008472 [Rhizoctonia solani]|nr:hypothetical protein OPQ81_008472 [Rhizoctonia solani]
MSPIGVSAALQAASDPSISPKRTIFDEFSLNGKVAVVTGGNRGLGLEMALALCEAGATVYAFDLPEVPGEEFTAASEYAKKKIYGTSLLLLENTEGRMDICIAAAGIGEVRPCLTYEANDFQRVMDVNTNGVFYTAQELDNKWRGSGTPGSIILIASMAGSITLRGQLAVAYQSSKAAVVQMARSMACELGPQKIRVNTISPGYINTKIIAGAVENGGAQLMGDQNPFGRIGRPDELRGVVVWLASDASSFCTGSDILVDGGHHSW